MKISVVIPVYKKESCIKARIESCLNQDFDDFEIIAVDDGSPDRCGEICDEIAAKDSRLKVFHKENGGTSAARKYGVEHSSGEYITFVDADDELLPGALRRLYDVMSEVDADEVIGGFIQENGNKTVAPWKEFVEPDILIENLLRTRNSFCVVWGILFKRDVLEGCFDMPREVVSGEDIAMQINVLMKNPKVYILQEPVYFYKFFPRKSYANEVDIIPALHATIRKALQPNWDKYETLFRLYQIKHYESYLERGNNDERLDNYYASLRTLSGNKGIPIADRMVLLMPKCIGRIIVRTYRRWLRHK